MKPDKFSLDYVVSGQYTGGSRPEVKIQPTAGESALDEATIVFSQPILQQLRQAPNKEMRLHDLVEKVNAERAVSSFEEFQGVITRLADLGFLEVVGRDIRGNHLLRLLKGG